MTVRNEQAERGARRDGTDEALGIERRGLGARAVRAASRGITPQGWAPAPQRPGDAGGDPVCAVHGLQWNALPREIGASTTVYDRFREWERAGFFQRLWAA